MGKSTKNGGFSKPRLILEFDRTQPWSVAFNLLGMPWESGERWKKMVF